MGKQRQVIKKTTEPYHRNGKPVKFKIGAGVRKVIIKRDGFVCRYCSVEINYETHTIDHVVPTSLGGTEDAKNLVMCCVGCNKTAKNLLFPTFETKKQYLLKAKNRKRSE